MNTISYIKKAVPLCLSFGIFGCSNIESGSKMQQENSDIESGSKMKQEDSEEDIEEDSEDFPSWKYHRQRVKPYVFLSFSEHLKFPIILRFNRFLHCGKTHKLPELPEEDFKVDANYRFLIHKSRVHKGNFRFGYSLDNEDEEFRLKKVLCLQKIYQRKE